VVSVVEYIKIPAERLEVLKSVVGDISERTQTEINIDEELCEIEIIEKEGADLLLTWVARDVVKAIGRGFEPEIAFRLFEKSMELKIIELRDFIGKSKNALIRIRGRIIGRDGSAKQVIEDATETNITVYGKTVAIIGRPDKVENASRAISMLASGSKHGSVYKMLEGLR
jgi:ribosomal RNA assembly protein